MVSSKWVVSELYRSCNAQTTEEKKKEESMDWDWRKFGWEEIEIETENETETELTEGRIRDTLLAGWGKNIGNGEILLGNGGNKSEEKSKKVVRKSRVSSPRSPKGANNLTCLVDDCEEDLSHCKDYHRRHRVCEHHSKIPVVFVRGEEKRFCQQCSRFHSLDEFDEAKRSCRKRLDGHNRRRRKGQPESLYLTSEEFPSNFKGPKILQFSSPQLNMQSIDGRIALPPYVRKPEAAAIGNNRQKRMRVIDRNTPRDLSFAPICNAGDKQFSSKQKSNQKDGNKSTPRVSARHPLPFTIGSSPESGRGSHGISQPVDSGCALYLLSSRPTQASELGLSCLDFLPQEQHYPCLKEKPAFPEDMAFQTRGHDGFFEDQLPTSWE